MEFKILGPLEVRRDGRVLPCKGTKQRQLLAALSYEEFLQPEIARLEELRLAAVEDRIDAELALGHHGELVAQLERLAGEHPLRERLRGQLMLALYRTGRQAEALEVYRDTRSALVDELGIEPGRALKELERAILTQDASLDPEREVEPAPGLVGREREQAKLQPVLD